MARIEREVSKATQQRKAQALRWFFNATKTHYEDYKHSTFNTLKAGKNVFIGGLFHFLYDAKWKDELPYWDMLPLVIPINIYSDGFLGLNLHYLPNNLRVKLLDILSSNLEKTLNAGKYTERKYLAINYQILKGVASSDLFSPCIKRYLKTHIKSSFIKVSHEDWTDVALLPTAKFQKKSESYVHKQVKYKG
ncbi:MAG: hypothetical protein PHC28_15755 [Flavobacterium sp.]|uniref:hypothetical protein n=1 Tax=Flavobacterium sp. TaxID=239 RepID=UPI002615E517|nr:hypothetical protein [Flavobacterium sp.]MDD5151909.1 hypothetical protein [Flavobacterium sp.]